MYSQLLIPYPCPPPCPCFLPPATEAEGTPKLVVLTIVVAAEGRIKLPPIRSIEDVKSCLKRLGAIQASKLVSVELLWTPQADGDFYTMDDIIADYPDMTLL